VSCETTSAHEEFETRCRERFVECGVDPTQLDVACETSLGAGLGDGGGTRCLLTPEVMDAFHACLEESCDTIEVCFSDVEMQYQIQY
jgi:hypothetical protein